MTAFSIFNEQVYVLEIECDVARGTTQNVHKRTEAEIRLLAESWEETPAHFHKVDLRGFLQENEITEVDMEDAKDDADKDKDLSKKETEEEEVRQHFW